MSFENLKKLEDYKELEDSIYERRYEIIKKQKSLSLNAALREMADYIKTQGFEIEFLDGRNKGFNARYKNLFIGIAASAEGESAFISDYDIEINIGPIKETVFFKVAKGARVDPVRGTTAEQQVADYEQRILPQLKLLDDQDLNGSYELFKIEHKGNTRQTIKFQNGKEVIDSILKKL